MARALATFLFALAAYQAAALAQAQTITSSRLNLTLEQKHVIKEFIKGTNVLPSAIAASAVGDVVPADTVLQPMPDEVMRKVPQVKAHSFAYSSERILIVDPKDNTVAETIELD
jgi:hypothetical protein